MPTYEKTTLWQRTLAARADDSHGKERDLLRTTFEKFHKRVKPIATSIAHDLPDFTIHDASHLDALWEYADLIAGSGYDINPCEAFVLGGAFLIHDLGMGLAAYPDGFAAHKESIKWKDALAKIRRDKASREGNKDSDIILSAQEEFQATAEVLRQVHAERAAELALASWTDPDSHEHYFLIDNVELRHSFGPIIGRIAHSHWWSVEELESEFPAPMGADTSFPIDWTIDSLKLACLLRLADFAHLDDRRAPVFRRLLQKPSAASEPHWQFQAKLYQPRLDGDRLVYTAKSGFPANLSTSWWLCFDTLVGLDNELRRVDALLADSDRTRFAARGVSQADEPSRLSKLIPTIGWTPVDTRIRVSAVANLVAQLGGEQLYGDRTIPPLRELFQNASDAIHARRIIDKEEPDWGEIVVRSGREGDRRWIEVEDCGVGMSEAVLTGPFLDFGTSFWRTSLYHKELPGVEAAGFRPIGRFGIGFYSVFMWGDHITITTQKFDRARAEALVLEFQNGLTDRPLLRPARPSEYFRGGGTRVRIWLRNEEVYEQLFVRRHDSQGEPLTLEQLCASVYPASDINIVVESNDGTRTVAVAVNDWMTIEAKELFERLSSLSRNLPFGGTLEALSSTELLPLVDTAGHWYGRAGITLRYAQGIGITTIGGLRAGGIQHLFGLLTSSARTASRDWGIPDAPKEVLRDWAERQWEKILKSKLEPYLLFEYGGAIAHFGVDVRNAPIVRQGFNWLTGPELVEFARSSQRILITPTWQITSYEQLSKSVSLAFSNNVLILDINSPITLEADQRRFSWPEGVHEASMSNSFTRVFEAIAEGWSCPEARVSDQLGGDIWSLDTEIMIGTFNNKPIRVRGAALQKPIT